MKNKIFILKMMFSGIMLVIFISCNKSSPDTTSSMNSVNCPSGYTGTNCTTSWSESFARAYVVDTINSTGICYFGRNQHGYYETIHGVSGFPKLIYFENFMQLNATDTVWANVDSLKNLTLIPTQAGHMIKLCPTVYAQISDGTGKLVVGSGVLGTTLTINFHLLGISSPQTLIMKSN